MVNVTLVESSTTKHYFTQILLYFFQEQVIVHQFIINHDYKCLCLDSFQCVWF